MATGLGALPDGGRVVIVGGGPGGAGCALALQRLAAQMGRRLQVTIVEGKQFAGEHHYNQCAGVLSPPLPDLLQMQLDIPFPYHLSRGEIEGYVLHTAGESIVLGGDRNPSIALRRVQFDAWMLQAARDRGVKVLHARVVEVEFHEEGVMVYTDNEPLEADVVVGAFGLDEGSAGLFSRQTAYHPPQALSSVVTKYHPGEEGMKRIGNFIHAFLPTHARIEFAAVTPKGNHLTINIAGKTVDVHLMKQFLAMPEVRQVLPNLERAGQLDPADLRFFKGRFPYSLARGYYGDRYVMVGDAAGLVRAFKGKGVTSAVQSAIYAAETILREGISQEAFDRHYRLANREVLRDLPYGRVMRLMAINMARYGLMKPVVRAARASPRLQSALFNAISAHRPYSLVFQQILHPQVLLAVLGHLLG